MFVNWQNLEDHSIENGKLTKFNYDLFHYSSTIKSQGSLFYLTILYNQQGIVREFSIKENDTILFKGSNKNGWVINDDYLTYNEPIYFIDISITPFTNTLPIIFLKYHNQTKETFPILFFDVYNKQFTIYYQKYSLIEGNVTYENVNTQYMNYLTIDKNNLVLDYPDAFIRI